MNIRRVLPRALAVTVGLGLAIGGSVAVAGTERAPRPTRPPAVVSLGDSYISGEAGRWEGNSADATGNRGGTDRAFVDTAEGPTYDPTLVYGESAANGCHRSDVAPITRVRWPRLTTINLACSGAATVNVLRASAGGQPFKGEPPQNDELAVVARQYKVEAIALSIGGNDLGFANIVTTCVVAFLTKGAPCSTTLRPGLDEKLPVVQAAIVATVNDVRATMTEAGYDPRTYRLVLNSYPIGVPAAADVRYPEAGTDRTAIGGCPLYDVDIQAGHDTLTGAVNGVVRAAAEATGTQLLDLADTFRGHELCSTAASQPTGEANERTSEWLRWIDLAGQGDLNESFHPNAFGQKAIGRCLALAFLIRRDVACHGRPNHPANAVFVTLV
jgi:hypothetical protein